MGLRDMPVSPSAPRSASACPDPWGSRIPTYPDRERTAPTVVAVAPARGPKVRRSDAGALDRLTAG